MGHTNPAGDGSDTDRETSLRALGVEQRELEDFAIVGGVASEVGAEFCLGSCLRGQLGLEGFDCLSAMHGAKAHKTYLEAALRYAAPDASGLFNAT
jgi:hypothetical protein